MKDEAAPTALERLIAAIVRDEGPIGLESYWDLALFHPDQGYYTRRDPFGAAGDFVTAPEISQMFGELLGAWCLAAWSALGRPTPLLFAEIGPGRGTLMADMLRTVARLDPAFAEAADVVLVETSDRLARRQAERLAEVGLTVRHVPHVSDLGGGPLLLVANELFDAVAIRQWVHAAGGWHEKRVGLDAGGRLAFGLTLLPDASLAEAEASGWLDGLPVPLPGATLEISPQRMAITDAMAAHLSAHGGAALMIDYGHARRAYGDTLQAMRAHAFADPLRHVGDCDLTSHVDFAALAGRFAAAGLAVAPIAEQGDFLLRLGLAERAGALGRGRSREEQGAVETAARRLAGRGEGEMGRLFKVLAVASRPLALPPFAPFAVD